MDHTFKDYLEARLPGLKKQVGYWYPASLNALPSPMEPYHGTLIIPRKFMKNLALPIHDDKGYGLGQSVTDGQIFLITNGKHELYFMQVKAFDHLRINRDGEYVFHDVIGNEPDNLDVLNSIHLAKVLHRR